MTYEQWLTNVRKLHPEVARYVDPIYASGIGLGERRAVRILGLHAGAARLSRARASTRGSKIVVTEPHAEPSRSAVFSFPGGNDGIQRCIVKWLNPEAIEGSTAVPEVHNGRIRFDLMDRPNTPCRLRGGRHGRAAGSRSGRRGGAQAGDGNLRQGREALFRARAHGDLGRRELYGQARGAEPAGGVSGGDGQLSAVADAVGQCRAGQLAVPLQAGLQRRARGEAGSASRRTCGPTCTSATIGRRSIPDQPNLFTFYVPFNQHGLSLVDQGHAGRARLFSTSYREYETQVRQQMVTLFASAGFDPARDIAGIVMNRWGHAYCNAGPGFYTPRRTASRRQLIYCANRSARLAFAHSELNGNQHWPIAAGEGRRAALQVVEMLGGQKQAGYGALIHLARPPFNARIRYSLRRQRPTTPSVSGPRRS